jgi:hypothetical protein
MPIRALRLITPLVITTATAFAATTAMTASADPKPKQAEVVSAPTITTWSERAQEQRLLKRLAREGRIRVWTAAWNDHLAKLWYEAAERNQIRAYLEVAARRAREARQRRASTAHRASNGNYQAGGACTSRNHSGCIPAKYPCAIPASICGRESGMNINIRYAGPVSSNAAGKYQFLGSTWRHACNVAGHPEWAEQWPSAADAPEEYQDAAAAALWNSPGGPGNW